LDEWLSKSLNIADGKRKILTLEDTVGSKEREMKGCDASGIVARGDYEDDGR